MDKLINLSALYELSGLSILFFLLAFVFSIIYGLDGVREAKEEECREKDKKSSEYQDCKRLQQCLNIKFLSHFLSDFLSSLIGWTALYVLIARLMTECEAGSFEIFLGIVAIAGIAGFGYRLPEWFGKKE